MKIVLERTRNGRGFPPPLAVSFHLKWPLRRRRKDHFTWDGSCDGVAKTISLGMALATASQRPFHLGWLLRRRRKDHFTWDGSRDGVAKTISLEMALATASQRLFHLKWLSRRRRKDHFARDGSRNGVAKTISSCAIAHSRKKCVKTCGGSDRKQYFCSIIHK